MHLPPKVQMDVMSLLSIKKSAARADLYKRIKDEILRIHAPRKQDTYKKALSRVLTGLPSQLGQELINDICDQDVKLVGCCCAKAVFCLWSIQLPLTVTVNSNPVIPPSPAGTTLRQQCALRRGHL